MSEVELATNPKVPARTAANCSMPVMPVHIKKCVAKNGRAALENFMVRPPEYRAPKRKDRKAYDALAV